MEVEGKEQKDKDTTIETENESEMQSVPPGKDVKSFGFVLWLLFSFVVFILLFVVKVFFRCFVAHVFLLCEPGFFYSV